MSLLRFKMDEVLVPFRVFELLEESFASLQLGGDYSFFLINFWCALKREHMPVTINDHEAYWLSVPTPQMRLQKKDSSFSKVDAVLEFSNNEGNCYFHLELVFVVHRS
jgi:hypothetical protein